jgi:ubiquinone/menaquinone biosynthesis C-methylase UbiE
MSLYGRFFAAVYDRMMAATEKETLRAHRRALLAGASGRVVEIGGGTGANLPFYGDEVEELTITEPEAPMARRLERHLREQSLRVRLVPAPAEQLPFESGSFDTAVSTLVLCTVDDQPQALAELRRVLKPGGRLLFIEHTRADEARLARWQDRFNPLQQRVAHGCNCNRATLDAIRAAGFTVSDVQHDQMKKAPPIVRPLIVGAAQVDAGAG